MELIVKCCVCLAALALLSAPAFSREVAIMHNGFEIRLDHRETRGDVTRLFMDRGNENYVDVRQEQIARFEPIEEIPDPPAADPVHAASLAEIVTAASNRYGVDSDLLLSLISAESAFNRSAVSPKGALGLMQLMPQTAASLGVLHPMDPASNVEGGTRYLQQLLTLYHHDLIKTLAAYNAGPGRIQQYGGVPPYSETIAYVARVVNQLKQRKLAKKRTDLPSANKREASGSF